MLRINRLRIVVDTESGKFGFDEKFDKKLNFIASHNENTRGKSSCIEAIYYCLGLEELIGGKNEKVLKPVFRNNLKYGDRKINVLESSFYLEIENSKGIINTIYRPGKKSNEKANLVRIYKCSIEDIKDGTFYVEDMYVHMKGSASNEKGFHKYLENFLGLNLPDVPSYDDRYTKLYLQIIFSTIFTEQKRGWADLFSCIPTYLKVRDPKKRIVEFLIGLESLETEKKKQLCKDIENNIKKEWDKLYNNIKFILDRNGFNITNISPKPEIIDLDKKYSIYKYTNDGQYISLKEYIENLKKQLESLNTSPIIIGNNIDDLYEKLEKKQAEIMNMEDLLNEEKQKILKNELNIKILKENIKNIDVDLQNNSDIRKIKQLGSTDKLNISNDICPTCNQNIKDILLPQNIELNVMSIDDNIKHLKAQKSMLEFTLKNYIKNNEIYEININKINIEIKKSGSILKSIKNDLYSVDSNISETIVRNKLIIENEIDEINDMEIKVKNLYDDIIELSKKWQLNLSDIEDLPKSNLTDKDKEKLNDLRTYFVKNLVLYGYKSISDFSEIEISEEKLLPIVSGFDMKFDSSASDNVRAIWAFNVALMQTSIKNNGNHPNILIFDEPGQQSLIISDLCEFIKLLSNIKDNIQVIVGITIDDDKMTNCIKDIDKSKYNLILVDDYSIRPLD